MLFVFKPSRMEVVGWLARLLAVQPSLARGSMDRIKPKNNDKKLEVDKSIRKIESPPNLNTEAGKAWFRRWKECIKKRWGER